MSVVMPPLRVLAHLLQGFRVHLSWSDLVPIPGIFGGLTANRTQIPFTGSTYATSFISPNLVDAVGNDPTECCHVRVTAGTASLTVYTSIYPQLSVNASARVSA